VRACSCERKTEIERAVWTAIHSLHLNASKAMVGLIACVTNEIQRKNTAAQDRLI